MRKAQDGVEEILHLKEKDLEALTEIHQKIEEDLAIGKKMM